MARYQVVVDDIGTVYDGDNPVAARKEYGAYKAALGRGRIGLAVALVKDGDVELEARHVRRVRVTIDVNVLDAAALLAYARANVDAWGLDADAFEGGDESVPGAVYEAIVNNCPPGGPDGVGLEIFDYKYDYL